MSGRDAKFTGLLIVSSSSCAPSPSPACPKAMGAGWSRAVFKVKIPNEKFLFSVGAHTKLLCGVFSACQSCQV